MNFKTIEEEKKYNRLVFIMMFILTGVTALIIYLSI